ncbi:MAG: glycoside hydrolase family 5 protein [Prolixibacteraceae bacterium]|jgi:endoglucanase|nr:glycoside hydrolase family 5 protein [Prolixibacteraceae bacterium]MBT6005392.1 glycoside hydrolase family 5 protein [Prolixibacteraceae bacterium]MBT6763871.1 glycoside hydrolase family 5 protein [Prolixibacteraceae bacterium]MBT7000608.1 glycoside hydrolase family 5 protein [Prolixibacteraceae bacterium]MBT7395540.1 glycoside hydrolase family 5 protein [Prolixibacteraceae bacterium]
MKNQIVFLFSMILFSCQTQPTKTVEKFEVNRGTNVAHWLSQSRARGEDRENFLVKSDIEAIAEMGFDHVRLPIDEEQMWDENGNRYNDAFQIMTNCIDWCAESNLRVIVDLHILRSHHFNAEEKPLWTDLAEQEKFYDLWRDLSKALIKYPNSLLAYELMNEAVADDPELWNNLVANAFSAIRKIEPERTIVIGSNKWQQVGTFDELKVPENDPNILLSFHFYEPFLLTHFNASWTSLKGYTGPVHYPGTILTQTEFDQLPEEMKSAAQNWIDREFDKHWILEQWEKPLRKAKELNLPLYCGEFGIIVGPPEEDFLNWYQDIIDLFEETGIAYANWNYKSGSFGLIDSDGTRKEKLIQIVSGK